MEDSLGPRVTRASTSLIYPPTDSGHSFPRQTYKWRFHPWAHTFLYGTRHFTYKAIKSFPYQRSAEVSTRKSGVEMSKSAQATNWQNDQRAAPPAP